MEKKAKRQAYFTSKKEPKVSLNSTLAHNVSYVCHKLLSLIAHILNHSLRFSIEQQLWRTLLVCATTTITEHYIVFFSFIT